MRMHVKMFIIIRYDHDDQVYRDHDHENVTVFPFLIYKTQTQGKKEQEQCINSRIQMKGF
jgi:hypothetical protein